MSNNSRTLRLRKRKFKLLRAKLSLEVRKSLNGGHLFNLPEIYREHLDDPSCKYFCVKGGRGAVKSFSFVSKLLEESFNPVNNKTAFIMAREIQTSIEDSVYGLCKILISQAQLEDQFTVTQSRIVNKKTGVQFLFMGLRATGGKTAGSQLNKIKGKVAIRWVFVDESQDLSADVINVLFPTANRGTKSGVIPQKWHRKEKPITEATTRFLFAMNVHLPVDPIIARLRTMGEQARVIHVNIFDLPKEFQDEQLLVEAQACEGEAYYEHVWLGAPFANFGGFPFMNHKFENLEGMPNAEYMWLDPSYKGKDFTAVSFLGSHPEFGIVAWGYCFKEAWYDESCLEKIERLYKKFNPSRFYYEDNNLGLVPQRMLAERGVASRGETTIVNKESKIYKAAMYTARMITVLVSHSNSDYIENLRYYSDEAERDDGADAYASNILISGIIKEKIKW